MDGLLPSYEELAGLVVAQAGEIERLVERVAELERRLGLNSRNSSLPPSSDGLGKPPPRSLRERGVRRPGGQPGSVGVTLEQVAQPDEVVVHGPDACVGCGVRFGSAVAGWVAARRQVFEVARVRVRVVEHRLLACRCSGCGVVSTGISPPGVQGPVQYGPRIAAVVVYLLVRQHLPVARVAELCTDLLGVPVSTGWVAAQVGRAADRLGGFDERARQVLRASPVVHFDESGARAQGRTRWVHSASTDRVSVYDLHEARGRAAIDAGGVLPAFTGIAVHDCWKAYFTYTTCEHALCNAHILRELTGWYEHDPHRHAWARQAIDLLGHAQATTVTARTGGHTTLPTTTLSDWRDQWDTIITTAQATHHRPATGRDPLGALINRLADYTPEIWRFAHDLNVPFDNNQAERDLRMIKLQIKISGCWRTTTNAERWLRVRSYISTLIKNQVHILTGIYQALTTNPWLPTLPTTT